MTVPARQHQSSPLPASVQGLARAAVDTPCFVLDRQVVAARMRAMQDACASHGAAYTFPVKANPHPAVLDQARAAGLPLDLCSVEELQAALEAGFSSQALTICGAGLDSAELRTCVKRGVRVDLDSLDELAAMPRGEPRAEVGLRIAVPAHGPQGSPSYGLKFGLVPDELPAAAALAATQGLHIVRLHLHGAPPTPELEPLLRDTLAGWVSALGSVKEISFGGGFGDGLSADWLGRTADLVAAGVRIARELRVEAVVFEPGEAVVGPAGWLLTRVRVRKLRTTPGGPRTVLITDTPYTTSVGTGLVSASYPIWRVSQAPARGAVEQCDVYGRNNTPLDLIAAGVQLLAPSPGTMLAAGGQGAYVASLLGSFNKRRVPPIHVV